MEVRAEPGSCQDSELTVSARGTDPAAGKFAKQGDGGGRGTVCGWKATEWRDSADLGSLFEGLCWRRGLPRLLFAPCLGACGGEWFEKVSGLECISSAT